MGLGAIRRWGSMRRAILCTFLVSLLFGVSLLLSASSICFAQSEDTRDDRIQQLNAIASRAHDYERAVNYWERNSTTIITLVVMIGIMGIAVSILQGFANSSCKVACIIM